jgi:tRNA(Arg) A34 adenosine deaminase TadA
MCFSFIELEAWTWIWVRVRDITQHEHGEMEMLEKLEHYMAATWRLKDHTLVTF